MQTEPSLPAASRRASRYQLLARIASGGMGTVYLATQRGAAGFRRIVAAKRAFPHLLEDPAFRTLLVSEARLASLVRHPNVVGISDVDDMDGELLLVMEYVEGVSLCELLKTPEGVPRSIGLRILLDAAEGLEAVHRCTDVKGRPLSLVHRDISPQNVLVGVDGIARIADFGIAQVHDRSATTGGLLRGKPSYMAPEYIETSIATPLSDVFALGVVAWETLTRRRLFKGHTDVDTLERVRAGVVPAPSQIASGLPLALDGVILRSLARDPKRRFQSARDFAEALESALPRSSWIASRAMVDAFVRCNAAETLSQRSELLLRVTGSTPAFRFEPAPDARVVLAAKAAEATVVENPRARVRQRTVRRAMVGAALVLVMTSFAAGALSARASAPAKETAHATIDE